MRSIGLLVSRLILGAYLAVHGAQKLFGSFGGHGLDATGARFEHLGMTPGKVMAGVARYDYEHVFIDNCSTDRTRPMVASSCP